MTVTTPARILFVGILPPQQNGASIMNARLLQGLSDRGYPVEAVAPVGPPHALRTRYADDPHVEIRRFAVPGLRMFPPAENIEGNFATYADRLSAMLPKVIAEYGPDLLLVGDESTAPAIPEVAKRCGLPTLTIAHGAVTAMVKPDYPSAARDLVLPALREMDMIVAVAGHVRETLERIGCERVRTIPTAVELDHFNRGRAKRRIRARLGLGHDDIVLMHSSNLRPYKRVADIIEAAALALRSEPRLRCMIVGANGVTHEDAELEAARRRAGMDGQLRQFGWRPYAAMPIYYGAADIAVMASSIEAAPLSYLEAQASGCVLLSSDIAAARDVVDHGRTGLLFPVGDVEALADGILRIAGDPGRRDAMASEARKWVAANRPFEGLLDAYGATIDELNGAARRP